MCSAPHAPPSQIVGAAPGDDEKPEDPVVAHFAGIAHHRRLKEPPDATDGRESGKAATAWRRHDTDRIYDRETRRKR